ncbi:MAG: YcaO-like family protein [Gammaproteobacteria bacterium]|jgi:ribosomal protein S12 methylthiotransferase accessory factor|nr:YcaO-like family protein [Gammaproteobacteria bacterium]MBT4722638.1 YcaO-like family protein [Candidatus Falkowbacteria bacterium]MBT4145366.1 YcaO-like family protein [Gammaproteobacteria bacterium]MBT5221951.1 YcaO-like family protein [Gammaproteobacteria bacterium]MBT5825229.1 YcaO-like family protein [Gammaproteobacteria bacterium]
MGNLRRLTDVSERVVNSKTGIIQRCYELTPQADAPQFFHYYAHTSNCEAFSDNENFRNTGGVATTRKLAMAKAIGESIERYSSALFDQQALPLESFRNGKLNKISPDFFNYFSEEQFNNPDFPYAKFTQDTLVRWSPTINLSTFEEIHVPASAIWMPYFYDSESGELPIMQPISTGLSAHCSLVEATLGGLLEVVERDSFSLTWQGCLSHPKIIIETLSDANYELVQRIEAAGHEVHLLNATTELGIPVILGVAFHERYPSPPFVVSAAAELNPEVAVRKALEELVHTRRYMREVQEFDEVFNVNEEWDKVAEQIHHLRLWGDRAMLPKAQFLTRSEKRISFDSLPNLEQSTETKSLKHLVELLKNAGYQALAADLTTPDVASMGFRVVRALIPGLHPFFIGHRLRARNHPRLFEVPQKLGFPAIQPGADNPIPHPFP